MSPQVESPQVEGVKTPTKTCPSANRPGCKRGICPHYEEPHIERVACMSTCGHVIKPTDKLACRTYKSMGSDSTVERSVWW